MNIEIKLAWLAGLWDGEGTITVFNTKREDGTNKLCPSLVLVNTSESIIAESVKILDEIGVSMHLFKRKPERKEWKEAYQLTTRNMTSIKKLLETLMPYLIGKKAQAELTLRFINLRLNQRENGGWMKCQYSEEEQSLCDQLKALNKKGK